jgi:hypothetical protein
MSCFGGGPDGTEMWGRGGALAPPLDGSCSELVADACFEVLDSLVVFDPPVAPVELLPPQEMSEGAIQNTVISASILTQKA